MATTYSIEQLLVKEAGRIGPEIYRRTIDTSAWLKLTKQEQFPEEMGDVISSMTFERFFPSASLLTHRPEPLAVTSPVKSMVRPVLTGVSWVRTLLTRTTKDSTPTPRRSRRPAQTLRLLQLALLATFCPSHSKE